MKRILVGVDGSNATAAALGWAGLLACVVGAEVVVANVFEPDQVEISPDRYENLTEEAERRLDTEWSDPLRDSRAPRRSLLLTGSLDALLEAAEDEDAGLVLVGQGLVAFEAPMTGCSGGPAARTATLNDAT